jgi:hypothetical protein
MAKELVKICGMRKLILLLLLALILSYLFSRECFDVVMTFLTITSFDASNMQSTSSTRVEDESDFGEWDRRLKKLTIRRIESKTLHVSSIDTHWRKEGINWYANGYLYTGVKYVLYYEKYCFIRDSGTKYHMHLTDVTTGVHRKFIVLFPYVSTGNIFITYFHHAHFDLFSRSSRLQIALYTEVHEETGSCETSTRRIANYSGVLISPSMICRFRKDRLNVA